MCKLCDGPGEDRSRIVGAGVPAGFQLLGLAPRKSSWSTRFFRTPQAHHAPNVRTAEKMTESDNLESRLRAFLHQEAEDLRREADRIDGVLRLDPRMADDQRVREHSATIHGRISAFAAVRALLEAWEINAAGGFSPERVIGSCTDSQADGLADQGPVDDERS